jgi:hypothetical protein
MKKIIINTGKGNWLNEKKLSEALRQVFDRSWLGEQFEIVTPTLNRPKKKIKVDCAYMDGKDKIAVEYEGNMHYVNTLTSIQDEERLMALKDFGYRVIRFPYYLELDDDTFYYFFGESVKIVNENPRPLTHGFNETKWLPVDFCPRGIKRFENEFNGYPDVIKKQITESIHILLKSRCMNDVLSKELVKLLGF